MRAWASSTLKVNFDQNDSVKCLCKCVLKISHAKVYSYVIHMQQKYNQVGQVGESSLTENDNVLPVPSRSLSREILHSKRLAIVISVARVALQSP